MILYYFFELLFNRLFLYKTKVNVMTMIWFYQFYDHNKIEEIKKVNMDLYLLLIDDSTFYY